MTTTPALDRLIEELSSTDGQKALLDWIGNPLTQDILAAARELSRPKRPVSREQTDVDMALGETIGANAIVDFFCNPIAVSNARANSAGMPVPDYGARTIVKKEKKHA